MQFKPLMRHFERGPFLRRFLHAVFAEMAMPGLNKRRDGGDRLGFGDGQQLRRRRIATGKLQRRRHALGYVTQFVGGMVWHGSPFFHMLVLNQAADYCQMRAKPPN
jgi:hypothetical protein